MTFSPIDADVLMDLPELYRYGREGKWFGLKWFSVYMFDGVVQVCSSPYRFRWNLTRFLFRQSAVIYFLIVYTYTTISARTDGWDVGLYEFSTVSFFAKITVHFLIYVFCLDNGFRRCRDSQLVQWAQHQHLDSLGFLCCLHWCRSTLVVHGEPFSI